MTSITTYTPIKPTYLCIKQHSITGLKYFCKTTQKNPIKYLGSGTYWKNHINKHGKEFVKTLWLSDLYFDTSIIEIALHFSLENNITESNDWANLIPEDGMCGGTIRNLLSDKTIAKMSDAKKGKPLSPEHIAKMSASRTGGKRSDETKAKMSATQKNRPPRSVETIEKLSIAQKGKIASDETKAKMSASSKLRKREPMSDETKAKMSATKLKKKLTIIL